MSFMFRPQRGSLKDSMAEAVELRDLQALQEHVKPWILSAIKPYPGPEAAHDSRIGWDTYIVLGKTFGDSEHPLGFVNASLQVP